MADRQAVQEPAGYALDWAAVKDYYAVRSDNEARVISIAIAEVERLRGDLAAATQGLHDIRGILGFDNDGDQTPGAQIAGARSIEKYVRQVVDDVREHRADLDAADLERDRG